MGLMDTRTCCCGCSVKDGTLILMWYHLCMEVLWIFLTGLNNLIVLLVPLVICVILFLGIYGINQGKRMFMLPFMILMVLEFIIVLLLNLAIVFVTFGISSFLNGISKSVPFDFSEIVANQPTNKTSLSAGDLLSGGFSFMSILVLMICVCLILIYWHLTKVVCTQFAQMGQVEQFGVTTNYNEQGLAPVAYPMSSPTYP